MTRGPDHREQNSYYYYFYYYYSYYYYYFHHCYFQTLIQVIMEWKNALS